MLAHRVERQPSKLVDGVRVPGAVRGTGWQGAADATCRNTRGAHLVELDAAGSWLAEAWKVTAPVSPGNPPVEVRLTAGRRVLAPTVWVRVLHLQRKIT